MIRKCNQCLSSTLKSNEPTIQVALDALKLTPFYNAFEVSADVPEIYMQEFWATVTKHHYSLRFKLKSKDSKKNNDMFYLRFTKVIVDYFMAKDPSISRINMMFWHTARDDSKFTTIRSEAYKTYHAYATGEKAPKPKKKKADFESSPKEKPAPASKGKRLKTSSKAA
ncbi:hypothetical protein Tco_0556117 [Tanacetum coccineum]